jgi:hypothetical protein
LETSSSWSNKIFPVIFNLFPSHLSHRLKQKPCDPFFEGIQNGNGTYHLQQCPDPPPFCAFVVQLASIRILRGHSVLPSRVMSSLRERCLSTPHRLSPCTNCTLDSTSHSKNGFCEQTTLNFSSVTCSYFSSSLTSSGRPESHIKVFASLTSAQYVHTFYPQRISLLLPILH